jgi:hypothetical protein
MECNRCENCQGRRKVLGSGGMQHDCKTCNGVGYITINEERVSPKRGRKPGSVKSCQKKGTSPSDDQASILKN